MNILKEKNIDDERFQYYNELYDHMKKRRKNKNFSIIVTYNKSIPFEREKYKYVLEIQGECILNKIHSYDNDIALLFSNENPKVT